jgi:DNA-binding response OmpR family regulator
MHNKHRVVNRQELLDRVWGTWFGDDHLLEVHISRLRRKIEINGGPRIAIAVRGVGYRLDVGHIPI